MLPLAQKHYIWVTVLTLSVGEKNIILMQTGWIQVMHQVTWQLAQDQTCLPLRLSFSTQNKWIFKVLNSRHFDLFLEYYPAFNRLWNWQLWTWLSVSFKYSTAHYYIDVISGYFPVAVNWNIVVFSTCEILKKVVHSLEPDETSSYSASHQAPNYVQRF